MDEVLSDHDMVQRMWGRLPLIEEAGRQLKASQDRLDGEVNGLRAEVRREMDKTREQLSAKVDDGLQALRTETTQHLGGLETHLQVQDETLVLLREKFARRKANWPRSATVFVGIAGSFAVTIIGLFATALINHWKF